jgi:hypothetical protein
MTEYNNEQLNEVASLAQMLAESMQRVDELEELLREAKNRVRAIAEDSLPSVMAEIGLAKIELADGAKVEVKDDIYASLGAGNKAGAFRWLEENHFGGLIKTQVAVEYGRNERDAAVEMARSLADQGCAVALKEDIHPQTLRAFLREQMAAGVPVPLDLFGARAVSVAKVKLPKKV